MFNMNRKHFSIGLVFLFGCANNATLKVLDVPPDLTICAKSDWVSLHADTKEHFEKRLKKETDPEKGNYAHVLPIEPEIALHSKYNYVYYAQLYICKKT